MSPFDAGTFASLADVVGPRNCLRTLARALVIGAGDGADIFLRALLASPSCRRTAPAPRG